MVLSKVKTASLCIVIVGAASGSVGVLAHWPSHGSKRPVQASAPATPHAQDRTGIPVKDDGSGPQPAQRSAGPQALASESCTDGCPVFGGADRPDWCPLTMAANTFHRILGHFHDSMAPAE
jgi:hypothetical protein